MNIAPGRGARLLLALLPFVLIAIVYVVASAERRAVNPDDKLLPPVSEMVGRRAARRLPARPALGRDRLVDRYRVELAAAGAGPGDRDPRRPHVRSGDRRPAARQRGVGAAGGGDLDGSADGDPAGAVHRVRAGRALEGGADRDRGGAVPHSRSLLRRSHAAGRADRQGAVARRLDLAGGDPGRAAAGDAATDRIRCGSCSARHSCS